MDWYSHTDVELNDIEIFEMNEIFINNDIETSNVGILPLNITNKLESNNFEAIMLKCL